MISNRIGKYSQALLVVGLTVLGTSASLQADDTEIYQTTYDPTVTGRPKVLIVIDDSGSMDTVIPNTKPAYDRTATYDIAVPAGRIYWTTSTSGQVPLKNSNNYFTALKNRCAESDSSLKNQGFFQGKAKYWPGQTTVTQCTTVYKCNDSVFKYPQPAQGTPTRCWNNPTFSGGNGNRRSPTSTQQCQDVPQAASWKDLTSSVHDPMHVECQADVNKNLSNGDGQPTGYARDNTFDASALTQQDPTKSLSSWGNTYTFYTSHRMNYEYDPDLKDDTRIQVAREVITSLIAANPGIDFGLMEFNGNFRGAGDPNPPNPLPASSNGGRIVQRIIKDMDAAQRQNVIDLVNSMNAEGSTPICESIFEAYNYLAGGSVLYGAQDDGPTRTGDELPRDPLAESPPETYRSPASDCAYTYVVLMTDGEPQYDTDANAAIETLTGKTCNTYPAFGSSTNVKNCLPEIAEYMANTDLDKNTNNGNQYGITYTIGFTTDQPLLKEAADRGDGVYYTADNAQTLTAAFQGAILSILSTETTFTSPAVAVDTFSRTQSRNDVYYAMFKPDKHIDWRGNIKKLKLDIKDGVATLVDKNTDAAIDSKTGFINATATTFWSTDVDGQDVDAGGVGALLAARDPATRTIKTNTGSGGALQDFNKTNITYAAFGLPDELELFKFFGVPNQADLEKLISWARGTDVYNEDGDADTTENRPWILADMLHSQPLVVNYGALPGFDKTNPDLRILVGTNGGFVHMFGDVDGQEDWAFFPKELAPVLRKRAINALSSQHVYGVDNTPVLYTYDKNRDGTITSPDDKAYVYLTLRRGGDAIYALDITKPDEPAFLWMIDPSSQCEEDDCPFGELGQSWSRPVVTYIPGYDSIGSPKPVLVFGAGYDTNKDNSGVATEDTVGRGLFVVDAVTGELVWKVTPAADSATNMQELDLKHSVAAPVSPLDSNGDEITDRVYMADTGGNLWRIDMPGPKLPTSSQEDFHISKMAEMNDGETNAKDRRFFNAPDIVRTSYQGDAFDAIAIGSGDRHNPNAKDNDDQFYMFRDEQVLPYFKEFVKSTMCDTDEDTVDDNRCGLPIKEAHLYDVTPNTIQTGTTDAAKKAAIEALSIAKGWRMDLTADGEKSLAKSITIDGTVYFTTFSPVVETKNLCVPVPGTGRLYAVRLGDATAIRDFEGDNDFERSMILGGVITDTLSPHFGADKEIRLLTPLGSPSTCVGDKCPPPGTLLSGASLPDPYGSFWYQEEY